MLCCSILGSWFQRLTAWGPRWNEKCNDINVRGKCLMWCTWWSTHRGSPQHITQFKDELAKFISCHAGLIPSLTYIERALQSWSFHRTKQELRGQDAQCIYSPSSWGIYPLLPHTLGQAVSIKVNHCGKYTGTYRMHPCRCTTRKVSHWGGQGPEEWYLANLGKHSSIINPIYRILHQLIYSFHSQSNSELYIHSSPGQIHDDEAPQDL